MPITLLNNLAFAFLAALLLTTLSLLVLLRLKKQNEANENSPRLRDQHQTSIPRWGGVGITQIIGIVSTSVSIPIKPSRFMRFLQWDQVIDVE